MMGSSSVRVRLLMGSSSVRVRSNDVFGFGSGSTGLAFCSDSNNLSSFSLDRF